MLELSPINSEIRITTTQAEKITPPDDAARWVLVDWRPLPVPSPGGVHMLMVLVWSAPVCDRCRAPMPARADLAGWVPLQDGQRCPACLAKDGGPMQAQQCCPFCDFPLPQPINRKLAPYCSEQCKRGARAQREARALNGDWKVGDPVREVCGNCRHWRKNIAYCPINRAAFGMLETCDDFEHHPGNEPGSGGDGWSGPLERTAKEPPSRPPHPDAGARCPQCSGEIAPEDEGPSPYCGALCAAEAAGEEPSA